MTPEDQDLVQARQRSRAKVTAILLMAFVVLMFGITIAKMGLAT